MVLGIFLFFLGLCIGSFLNAFLYRYETKQKLTGRSFCPKCKHQIIWYDNIPLLSWLILCGKCRHCKKPISLQYPIVELATGVLFFAFAAKFKNLPYLNNCLVGVSNANCQLSTVVLGFFTLLLSLLVASLLVLIAVYDFKTQEIPNGFNLAFIIASASYLIFSNLYSPSLILDTLYFILAGITAFLFLYIFVAVSGETWMGGGDAKFAFGMGLFLGPWNTLLAIIVASWTGAIFGVIKLLKVKMKNEKLKNKEVLHETCNERSRSGRTIKQSQQSAIGNRQSHEIPFGPFLVLGTIISFLFGSQIIAWYARIFLGF